MVKIIYLETSVFILVLIGYIYLKIVTEYKSVYARSIYIFIATLVLSIIGDMLWYAVDGNPKYINLNWLANILTTCSTGFIGYAYACYCHDSSSIKLWKNKFQKFLYMLPSLVLITLNITTYWTKLMFYINPAGYYVRGQLMTLNIVGVVICPLAVSLKALSLYEKCSYYVEKRKILAIVSFPIEPIFFSILQFILPPGLATINIGITMALLKIFITTQDSLITKDFLTNVNNRYSLDAKTSKILERYQGIGRKDKALYILMTDADNLKQINDTYGHAVGDLAIVNIARMLEDVCNEYNCLLGRVGGDEFAIVCEFEHYQTLMKMKDEIYKRFDDFNPSEGYHLSISIGFAEYDGLMSLNKFFALADKELYKVKSLKKTNTNR